MRPSSSNIFHISSAVHPSSLTATTSMRLGSRDAGSQCCTTSSRYGTRDMEASSWAWSLLRCGESPMEGMHESRSEHATS